MNTLILLAVLSAGPQQAPRPPQAPAFVEPPPGLLPPIAPKAQPCLECLGNCQCVSCDCAIRSRAAATPAVERQEVSHYVAAPPTPAATYQQPQYVPRPTITYSQPQPTYRYATTRPASQPVRQQTYSQPTYYQQPAAPTYYQTQQTYSQPAYRQPVRAVLGATRRAASSCGPRG